MQLLLNIKLKQKKTTRKMFVKAIKKLFSGGFFGGRIWAKQVFLENGKMRFSQKPFPDYIFPPKKYWQT